MTDPVVADDGYTYQREAIQEWFNKCTAGMVAGISSHTLILIVFFFIVITMIITIEDE